MKTMQLANPSRSSSLGSLGDANLMIVRQYNFPFTYENNEQHCSGDHDRIKQLDYDKAMACIKKHTGTGEMILDTWFVGSTDEEVISFIKDYLQADQGVVWTGYRIRSSVHRRNGHTIWSLELFSKNPTSTTKVYSDLKAPNVSDTTVSSGSLLPLS
jgi:hypothetical protein